MNTRKGRRISSYELVIIAFLGMLAIVALFPFYDVLIQSFAKYKDITQTKLYIWPKSFDVTSYLVVLNEPRFYNAFGVTVFVTVVGVAVNMAVSTCGAYALSKKFVPGRNFILTAILFTMFFNGGLIPYYLVVSKIGMVNSLFVMILPTAINAMYLIIMKNYFTTLPESLEESAKIDGANDLKILIRIVIPVSAPFIATFALFYAVARWNEWWNALIFINETKKAPLQIYLREVLINYNTSLSTYAQAILQQKNKIFAPGVQMANIVITAIPIILVYPFLQKHFTKGIMIGSIKG